MNQLKIREDQGFANGLWLITFLLKEDFFYHRGKVGSRLIPSIRRLVKQKS
jgi:hypothetical protein